MGKFNSYVGYEAQVAINSYVSAFQQIMCSS